MGDSPARSRSCVPEGAPDHGPGAVDVVPGHRSQPADVRVQHLSGDGCGFCSGNTTRVLHAANAIAHRAAGGGERGTKTIREPAVSRRAAKSSSKVKRGARGANTHAA